MTAPIVSRVTAGHVTVLTCVRGQVRAGGGAVNTSRVVLEGGRLLVVLHDGFQVARALLVAEVKKVKVQPTN